VSPTFLSTGPQSPVRAAIRSPPACGRFGGFQEGPFAFPMTAARSSFRLLKNDRHSASTELGSAS
jgi:hypothetical protein